MQVKKSSHGSPDPVVLESDASVLASPARANTDSAPQVTASGQLAAALDEIDAEASLWTSGGHTTSLDGAIDTKRDLLYRESSEGDFSSDHTVTVRTFEGVDASLGGSTSRSLSTDDGWASQSAAGHVGAEIDGDGWGVDASGRLSHTDRSEQAISGGSVDVRRDGVLQGTGSYEDGRANGSVTAQGDMTHQISRQIDAENETQVTSQAGGSGRISGALDEEGLKLQHALSAFGSTEATHTRTQQIDSDTERVSSATLGGRGDVRSGPGGVDLSLSGMASGQVSQVRTTEVDEDTTQTASVVAGSDGRVDISGGLDDLRVDGSISGRVEGDLERSYSNTADDVTTEGSGRLSAGLGGTLTRDDGAWRPAHEGDLELAGDVSRVHDHDSGSTKDQASGSVTLRHDGAWHVGAAADASRRETFEDVAGTGVDVGVEGGADIRGSVSEGGWKVDGGPSAGVDVNHGFEVLGGEAKASAGARADLNVSASALKGQQAEVRVAPELVLSGGLEHVRPTETGSVSTDVSASTRARLEEEGLLVGASASAAVEEESTEDGGTSHKTKWLGRVSGDTRLGQEDSSKVAASVERVTSSEGVAEDGVTVKDSDKQKVGAKWQAGKGTTYEGGWSTRTDESSVTEEGAVRTSSTETGVTASRNKSKDQLALHHHVVDSKETHRVDDNLTVTTTRGDTKVIGNVGRTRGEDGGQPTIGGSASTTALKQEALFKTTKKEGDHFLMPDNLTAKAGYGVGSASAKADASVVKNDNKLEVKSNIGAKVTAVNGHAKVDFGLFRWELGGETMEVGLVLGVNAEALASADASLSVNVNKSPDALALDLGGDFDAFIGVRGGVEARGDFRWIRGSDYGELLRDTMTSMPGPLDDWALQHVSDQGWSDVANIVFGKGRSDMFTASAGVTGSAGFGVDGSFGIGWNDGMLQLSGAANGAFGLGGGVKTNVGIHVVDGARLVSILGMRGAQWFADSVSQGQAWRSEVMDGAWERVDQWLEEHKQGGGLRGGIASVVDWLGDDVFDRW